MEEGILRNSGKILTAVIFILVISFPVSAAELKTEITRNKISAGENTTLKLMISGSTSDIKPLSVPAVDGLRIVMSGTSRSFQFINGKSWSGITLNFTIYAEKKGSYKIPSFVISADGERLQSDSVTLIVTEGTDGARNSSDGVVARGDVILSAADVYAGEPVLMRYYLNGAASADLQVEGIKSQPSSRGFIIKQINEQKTGAEESLRGVHVSSYCLIPADPGIHEIGGGSASVIVEVEDGFFSRAIRREFRFPVKNVNVKPLPSAGRPDDFRGDVGEFTIEAGDVTGSFRTGDEIRIPVKIKGRGNLLTLSKPAVEKQDGLKLIIEEKEPVLSADDKSISGEKDFIVTIIPEREGDCSIGRISLSFFNPYKKIYEKAESKPVLFAVSGISQKKKESATTEKPDGRGAVFYILLVIASAIATGGAVFLFMQARQFRAVSADVKDKTGSEERTETINSGRDTELLMNIEESYNRKDTVNFLLYSDRLTGLIDEEKFSGTDLEQLRKIKDTIHICRYGGGVIDSAKMDFIYSWLKRNVK